MFKTIDFRLIGVAPLIHHSDRLADPLDDIAKAMKKISGKRKKTDEDHEEIARLEFLGGLYVDENDHPIIPGENIEATLIEAARLTKEGKIATRALMVADNCLLKYDGPKDPEKLWEDKQFRLRRSVKVKMARVMRTRPRFPQWETEAAVAYDSSQLDEQQIIDFMTKAGSMIGLGDWRPRYGRFLVEVSR